MSFTTYIAEELVHVNHAIEAAVASLDPQVRPMAAHVMEAGGKRLRAMLTLLFGAVFNEKPARLYNLAAAIELLHAGTLLHDDILDDSPLRRGRPAAHILFKANNAVLAGDAMCALASRLVAAYESPRCSSILAEALLQTVTGEIKEIAYQRSTSHRQDVYLEIIQGKTAWLIRSACEAGAAAAGADEASVAAAAAFGLNLGMGFQIVDDALDFAASPESTGKPVGGDLREGKFTPPIMYYIDFLAAEQADELRQRFTRGDFSPEETAAISRRIHESGAMEKTHLLARTYLSEAKTALLALPESPVTELLAQAVDYVGSRTS